MLHNQLGNVTLAQAKKFNSMYVSAIERDRHVSFYNITKLTKDQVILIKNIMAGEYQLVRIVNIVDDYTVRVTNDVNTWNIDSVDL